MNRLLGLLACAGVLALALATPALARARSTRARRPAAAVGETDPAHWFATRAGLIRVYGERARAQPRHGRKKPPPAADADAEQPPAAGASCEVVESRPADATAPGSTRESCTMIVARMPRLATQLTYELRKSGIFMVKAQVAGKDPQTVDRLLLPGPIAVGRRWSEAAGKNTLDRKVKSVGRSCKAAGRSFGDCLVLAVVQRHGKKVLKKYAETYAAGVGLVEDAQWQLIDVKGL